jgi:pyruvate kinase
MPTPHKRAQIVATIGPASKDPAVLKAMIENGMDVARLNFSWGTYEEHAERIADIRTIARELNTHIPIIQDLSGPRIQEESGHEFDISAEHVLTEKDLKDLDFGAAQKVEYVAMSFVGDAHDVERLRKEMIARGMCGAESDGRNGAHNNAHGGTKLIAKIERAKALTQANLGNIIAAADAIMVARGDLGNEIPLERIPYAQLDIIRITKRSKKPVIVATQMMLSMTQNPTPTRAEVSDVAFAVIEGSDAVMLSEESASGKYPAETVAMMQKIILEAERHEYRPAIHKL